MTGATFFEDMLHGWVTRGDLKDEKVARDFHKAIHIAQDYFAKFKWLKLDAIIIQSF